MKILITARTDSLCLIWISCMVYLTFSSYHWGTYAIWLFDSIWLLQAYKVKRPVLGDIRQQKGGLTPLLLMIQWPAKTRNTLVVLCPNNANYIWVLVWGSHDLFGWINSDLIDWPLLGSAPTIFHILSTKIFFPSNVEPGSFRNYLDYLLSSFWNDLSQGTWMKIDENYKWLETWLTLSTPWDISDLTAFGNAISIAAVLRDNWNIFLLQLCQSLKNILAKLWNRVGVRPPCLGRVFFSEFTGFPLSARWSLKVFSHATLTSKNVNLLSNCMVGRYRFLVPISIFLLVTR